MKNCVCVFYGAGGHGKVALDIADRNGWRPDIILDDDPKAPDLLGVPVTRAPEMRWNTLSAFEFHVSIGTNSIRRRLFDWLTGKGGIPRTLIHPSASVSKYARLGAGCLVAAQAVINPGAQIGDNVIVNTSASVDHDCLIEDHVHIAPGVRLAGEVKIGCGTLIGIGACAKPGLTIGRNCVVGAGAVVLRDLPDNSVVGGNPAAPLRVHS